MADFIANWLLEHCPEMVRVLSSLSPWAVLALTAAILAALVIGSNYINSVINKTDKGREIPIRKAASKRKIPKELRELLRDEEEFDAEWMDEEAWRKLRFEEKRDRWSR